MSKVESTWIEEFEKLGAFWEHDGNPKRPYVRLASEKISNGFFNAGKVARHANVLHRACKVLVNTNWNFISHAIMECRKQIDISMSRGDVIVIGPAMGGITLAHEIASFMHAETLVAEKIPREDASGAFDFAFPRDQPARKSVIVLCEDTLTTGGSVLKVRDMIKKTCPDAVIAPFVLAILNRSGKDVVDGLAIKSLIQKSFQVWDEGSNPFTRDGKELVPPVKAKTNWDALTKEY